MTQEVGYVFLHILILQIKELGIARRGRGLLLLVPLECPRASLLLGCFEVAAC